MWKLEAGSPDWEWVVKSGLSRAGCQECLEFGGVLNDIMRGLILKINWAWWG